MIKVRLFMIALKTIHALVHVCIPPTTLRPGKVTSVLAVGIWVGFGLTLGLKRNAENNPKIDLSCVLRG